MKHVMGNISQIFSTVRSSVPIILETHQDYERTTRFLSAISYILCCSFAIDNVNKKNGQVLSGSQFYLEICDETIEVVDVVSDTLNK